MQLLEEQNILHKLMEEHMDFQEIMVLIQTGIATISLIISIITLNKVNQINNVKNNKVTNKQTTVGEKNKQTIEIK